ncbi:hypothetical protein BBV17_25135 [Cytobacillus oceanisediminis]|uniref:Uncharacterized protein n=1 Tax=Cytobacillus oceanisediminis TaxID=665099 RepID=A0ABX3CMQ2_9BACI|nr:hypothetical protein BBV17_25135 [Cytobacillus oceanisediminis]
MNNGDLIVTVHHRGVNFVQDVQPLQNVHQVIRYQKHGDILQLVVGVFLEGQDMIGLVATVRKGLTLQKLTQVIADARDHLNLTL